MKQLVTQLLREGHLSLPMMFLKEYKRIGLSDQEMMLIIHILAFKREGKDFPTIRELCERMSASEGEVMSMLQKLVQNNYLAIEDHIDPETGVRAEAYQFDPLYDKIAERIAALNAETSFSKERESNSSANLYSIFEQEFGRPLSPIECETIAMWQDQDRYTDELIIAALREAVMSNKRFIRYIDRILYEWRRNRIETAEQAREFSLRFRRNQRSGSGFAHLSNERTNASSGKQEKLEPFPFYNWLEN